MVDCPRQNIKNANTMYGYTGVYRMLRRYCFISFHAPASISFRWFLRHFRETYVNCQYPGVRAPPRGGTDILPADIYRAVPNCVQWLTRVAWYVFCWRRESGSWKGVTREVLELRGHTPPTSKKRRLFFALVSSVPITFYLFIYLFFCSSHLLSSPIFVSLSLAPSNS